MPQRNKFINIKMSGMVPARKALRGLSVSATRHAAMREADRKAAHLVLDKAKEYAPKRTHALVNSGRVVGSSVRFGNSVVDYVPMVLSQGQPFIARAIIDTKASRNELHQKAIQAIITERGLRGKR